MRDEKGGMRIRLTAKGLPLSSAKTRIGLIGILFLCWGACAIAAEPDIRTYPLTLSFNELPQPAPPAPLSSTFQDTGLSDQRMAYAQSAAQLQASASELKQKALDSGPVRIIVGVDSAFVPSGKLSNLARTAQEQGIALAQQALIKRLTSVSGQELRRFKSIPFVVLEVNADALELLATLPEVLSIEESVPDAPDLSSSTAVIGSPQAWTENWDGSGQVVAVLDTGVDKTHPFFSTDDKVVAEACFSSNTSGAESFCPGGATSSTASGSGLPCANSISGCTHGTHVAGIAVGNDHSGPNFGVARGAQLIAVQVFSKFSNPLRALSYPDDQIAGLEHIYDLRNTYTIAAVNMSLGGGDYSNQGFCDFDQAARKAAIDNLRSVGIVTVISTGNNGYLTSMGAPGCISSAISVSATTDNDTIPSYSNIASFVDLLAPGDSITSSVPGGGTANYNGTSMASPHVAGAWAVMKQRFPGVTNPQSLTVDEVLSALQNSGSSVADNRFGGSVSDMRRINLDIALELHNGFTVFNDSSTSLTISTIASQTPAPWISVNPAPPFVIAKGGMQWVTVSIDYELVPGGVSSRRLEVSSSDVVNYPNPGLVDIEVTTPDGPRFASAPVAGSEVDFGNVYVDSSSVTQAIEIESIGSEYLTISCNFSGTNSGEFVIEDCPETLAPATNGSVEINCSPASPGSKIASLDLTTNDPDHLLESFPVSCNGVFAEFDSPLANGSELDFGETEVGQSSAASSVQINNLGSGDLIISCELSGSNADEFSVDQCLSPVGASGSTDVLVSCQPDSLGSKTASLDLSTNDANEPSPAYLLGCAGVSPEFSSTPSPGFNHDFGEVPTYTVSAFFDVLIENLGSADLTLDCDLNGADESAFNIEECPSPVAVGGSSHIKVSCQSASGGDRTASLDVLTNDLDEASNSWGLHCLLNAPPPDDFFTDGFEE